ncbi:DJ-1/PfpI family protein [Glaciecola petra]|uniref:DJ-1/PfpI family protein n=1 Tax=Glaciecola petra TaxID=3075602 RepID=A0ABU2ZM79_9ALTE|nr:DJ-1/PfpI family protein [Aestuariibacter sp. P117]MDT0593731.1 DJ-1/PfpI family protein [Aestuariibacter sp. P117]
MKKLIQQFIQTIILTLFLLNSVNSFADSHNKKILMVLSGYGQQAGKETPGYEFGEFSKAYLVFKHHGIQVDIASPLGGQVEADKYDPSTPYNAAILGDNAIMAKLNNTLSIAALTATDYDGVFVVGGKGAMFDLPKSKPLQNLIADIYQQQGSVAAVCHGPAALVDVKLNDGSYLITNKVVNGFTNQEEKLFGKKWINDFEFMLEDKIIERGAKFESSDIMLNHVAVDGRLITGQNPSSTVSVAKELLKSIGIKIKPMPAYKDDATLALVAKVLSGSKEAEKALTDSKGQYNIPLVGMYGYYYLKVAVDKVELENALVLMSLAKEELNNPRIDLKIATVQHQLGKNEAALTTLRQLLTVTPDFKPAIEMLNTLTQ